MKKKMSLKYAVIVPVLALAIGFTMPNFGVNADELDLPSISAEDMTGRPFIVLNGMITQINISDEQTSIRVENEESGETDLIVSEKTLFADAGGLVAITDLNVGDEITVHYVEPLFMAAINPPQVPVNVIVKEDKEAVGSVYVGVFSKDLLAVNGDLKLNVNEDNIVVDQNNTPYEGSLENRALVVFYSVATLSIPPQTSPTKIIVLDEDTISAIPGITEEIQEELTIDKIEQSKIPSMQYFVSGNHVEAPSAYVNKNGVVMLPLRALVTASEYDIHWDGQAKQIIVGVATTLTIGEDSYTIGRRMPFELGAAPELINDVTFVPISFFTEVLNWNLDLNQGDFSFFSIVPEDTDLILVP